MAAAAWFLVRFGHQERNTVSLANESLARLRVPDQFASLLVGDIASLALEVRTNLRDSTCIMPSAGAPSHR